MLYLQSNFFPGPSEDMRNFQSDNLTFIIIYSGSPSICSFLWSGIFYAAHTEGEILSE